MYFKTQFYELPYKQSNLSQLKIFQQDASYRGPYQTSSWRTTVIFFFQIKQFLQKTTTCKFYKIRYLQCILKR